MNQAWKQLAIRSYERIIGMSRLNLYNIAVIAFYSVANLWSLIWSYFTLDFFRYESLTGVAAALYLFSALANVVIFLIRKIRKVHYIKSEIVSSIVLIFLLPIFLVLPLLIWQIFSYFFVFPIKSAIFMAIGLSLFFFSRRRKKLERIALSVNQKNNTVFWQGIHRSFWYAGIASAITIIAPVGGELLGCEYGEWGAAAVVMFMGPAFFIPIMYVYFVIIVKLILRKNMGNILFIILLLIAIPVVFFHLTYLIASLGSCSKSLLSLF
ncbi:MAG: hypothetical protein K9L85_02825 [Candidatus Peribacteraceae bacterium]|nr:hypothetical protein [Candidatus Peribacteraceae bacterium]